MAEEEANRNNLASMPSSRSNDDAAVGKDDKSIFDSIGNAVMDGFKWLGDLLEVDKAKNDMLTTEDTIELIEKIIGQDLVSKDKLDAELEKLDKEDKGLYIYNLGTGTGYSVLDMVKAFEKTIGRKVKYKIAPRRAGDIATCYADPAKAREELNWVTEKTLEDMCRDSWNYIQKNK
jgi:hypothetical protein